MSRIVRPPKTAGTNQYQNEVAAGAIDILDTEVDSDFNTIYTLVNGNLDDDNISGSPKRIAYAKLDLTGKIQGSDIAPGANIPGGTIVQDSITTRELAPNSVLLENIGPQQTTRAIVPNGDDANLSLVNNTEILCAESVWTSGGGNWIAHAAVAGSLLSGNQVSDITIRLRLDGTAGLPTDGTPIHAVHLHFDMSTLDSAIYVPFSAALLGSGQFLLPTFQPGPHRIKLTAQLVTVTGVANLTTKRIILHESA
jgi:hypothetical protein